VNRVRRILLYFAYQQKYKYRFDCQSQIPGVENIIFILGIILVISILFQFITALLGLRLIRITGMHVAWVSMVIAFFFMALRRCVSLSRLISGDVAYQSDLAAELIALVTSALMVVAVAWITPLYLSITRSKEALQKSEERIKHLNSVLKAIRNINQLIVVEKERESLLQKACDALIRRRVYRAAWIGFLQDGETFSTVRGSGLREEVSRLSEKMMGGDHLSCIRNALVQKKMVQVVDRTTACEDCMFKSMHTDQEAVIIRIEHDSRLFGLLVILLEPDVALDDKEVELLKEVASDIGLGLHNMEMEEALRESKNKISDLQCYNRGLIEASLDFLVTFNQKGIILDVNEATVKATGRSREELIGTPFADYFTDPEKAYKGAMLVFETREVRDYELVMKAKDGTETIVAYNASVYKDQNGKVIGAFADARDITEIKHAKASLKEKDVLMREIHHRVKNNLQVLSSLFNMQARTVKDNDMIDAFSESRNRINAMALVHSQLYESRDLSQINMKGFIEKLLMRLLQTYLVQDTTITRIVSVVDLPFPISIATPVGLIINELLSNALKHAFVDRKEGKIEIILSALEENRINLTISDDGIGLPEGFDIDKTKTLGLHLVKILVEDQLQGSLEVISKEGVTFNVEFDIEGNGGVYA
jgi:PAS domain S-box-containing protein